MDSPRSTISSLSANEATQHLKEILNLGKSSSSEISNKSVNSSISKSSISSNGALTTNGHSSEGSSVVNNFLDKLKMAQVNNRQQIILQGNDSCNSFSVYGPNVDIVSSHASGLNQNTPGSNKVKINPVVNFDWEHKCYIGNLVAAHPNGVNIAYALKGRTGGIIRVINRKTAERTLLKGFLGLVLDISFARHASVLLGAVDEKGHLYVYDIKEINGMIESSLVLQVNHPEGIPPSDYHRIFWCPYIPEDLSSSSVSLNDRAADDPGKQLMVTHGHMSEVMNVEMVVRSHGNGPLRSSDLTTGYLSIHGHAAPITDASFSPDGEAVATASLDGWVKFFSTKMYDDCEPSTLMYKWQPHNGKPVTSISFLDDHKHYVPDMKFWKFAITGCDDNQELKLWSCESWECLQTLKFSSPANLPSNFQADPCNRLALDLTANYMVLSDIRRKVLYVLQLHIDNEGSQANVCSISEFLLTQPCLSFVILDASRRKFSRIACKEMGDIGDVTTGEIPMEDEDEEVVKDMEGPEVGVLIKMYSVHTKAMQELQIRFKPESSHPHPPPPPSSVGSMSQDGLQDRLSDMSMETTVSDLELALTGRSNLSQSSALNHSVTSNHSDHGSLLSDTSRQSSFGAAATKQHASLRGADSPLRIQSPRSDTSQQSDRSLPPDLLSERSQHGDHSNRSLPLDLLMGERSRQSTPGSDRTGEPLNKSGSQSKSDFSYQGDLQKSSTESKPVLLTPDAFTSPRKTEAVIPLDLLSPTSSHTSSFTHVTAMDEDQMRTPMGSVSHTQPSPASSTTLTPSSSRDLSGVLGDTPSSLPLPPATPGEEAALEDSSPLLSTQKRGLFPPASTSPVPAATSSITSPTSSLATSAGQSQSELISGDGREEFFAQIVKQRCALQSTESSSSTSLEVSEILEGARLPEGMQEEEEEEEENNLNQDEKTPADAESELANDTLSSTKDSALYDSGAWPEPPDLGDVNREAHRLASEAIERAATLHLQNSDNSAKIEEPSGSGVTEKVCRSLPPEEAASEPGKQADDDVQIEEEKVEEDEEEDSVQPPIATSSLAGDYEEDLCPVHVDDSTLSECGCPSSSGDQVIHHIRAEPAADAATVREMQTTLHEMVNLLHSQQQELEALRSELNAQRGSNALIHSLEQHMESLEGLLDSKVAGALTQHSATETQRLHMVLTEKDSQERLKQERLLTTVSQTLDKTVAARLDKTVREEMYNRVMPGIANDIATKLTATDALVKDNMAKLIRSKQSIEAIGNAAGNSIHGHVQGICRDILIPNFDRSCQVMFQQINETFQKGTHEHLQQLHSHMESVRQRQEQGRDPVVAQLQSMVDAFRRREEARDPVYNQVTAATEVLQTCNHQLQGLSRTIETKLDSAMSSLEQRMVDKLQRIVQEEVNSAMKEQQTTISDSLITAMRSGALTPSIHSATPDPQRQQADILHLLQQGQLNTAFQQALSAADLQLVMFVCEYVDPAQVFSQAVCPLEQPVLLSLIQQLSADLESSTELKHRYLQEAVMNLDRNHTVTREHMPRIIGDLVSKLKVHNANHPSDPIIKQLRMLLMASQSLLS